MRRIVFVVALSFLVSGSAPLAAQDPVDACTLLPDKPALTDPFEKGACMGFYWQRTNRVQFKDLGEFHATIRISPAASVADAKSKATYGPGATRVRPLALGDGGSERAERPDALDQPLHSEQAISTNTRRRRIQDFTDPPYWSAVFSCGVFFIAAQANPTRGDVTRQLLVELESNLRAAGLCGGAAPAIAAKPPPPPTRPPADEIEPGGVRTFDGETAREISNADASGARYMVVLSRDWDPQQNCWVERRAWAGGIRGSDATRVTVQLGPVKTVCAGGAVVSAAEVNAAQRGIAEARNNLATALKQQESYEAIMKNESNPDHVRAAAAARHGGVQQWIDYYKKRIRELEAGIAQSVPD